MIVKMSSVFDCDKGTLFAEVMKTYDVACFGRSQPIKANKFRFVKAKN